MKGGPFKKQLVLSAGEGNSFSSGTPSSVNATFYVAAVDVADHESASGSVAGGATPTPEATPTPTELPGTEPTPEGETIPGATEDPGMIIVPPVNGTETPLDSGSGSNAAGGNATGNGQ